MKTQTDETKTPEDLERLRLGLPTLQWVRHQERLKQAEVTKHAELIAALAEDEQSRLIDEL